MPNNPVQIILNDHDFHQAPDPGQPPRNKDFFEGADKAFVTHKASLLAAIDRIIDEIQTSPYGPAAYLKVQMRNEALAKSYRPVWWLFKPDQFPCVGADAVGTLYFRAPLIYLNALRQRIVQAEASVETKYRRADNKPYKAPTIARAEVGAIETIEVAPPEQKRAFSTAAALAALEDPRAVSGYQVELFETPAKRVIADDPLGRIALRRSLERLLLSLGLGARSYAPPLDPAFGAEFVRVNLEASLKQRQPEPASDGRVRFTNQIAARYLPKSTNLAIPERALIDHGLKWWPAKQYESTFVENGSSSQWRLEVTSLVRAEAQFPAEGVPFAILLTLEDPDGSQPVFQEMRQWLQASTAVAQDVRAVTRLRPRGR